jgi:hypothetical protein
LPEIFIEMTGGAHGPQIGVSASVFYCTPRSSVSVPAIRSIGKQGHLRTDRRTIVGWAATPVAWDLGGGLDRSCLIVFVVEVISRFGVDRSRTDPKLRQISEPTVRSDYEAVIAEFIRTKGVTRCPTACVLPTQGSINPADQAALEQHAVAQERSRQAKAAARARLVWSGSFSPPRGK